jgi:hypothetical protein
MFQLIPVQAFIVGQKERAGMEAGGPARWFEQLVAELQFQL